MRAKQQPMKSKSTFLQKKLQHCQSAQDLLDSSCKVVTHEIPVYFGDSRKWVKGVDCKTTAQEVIVAILTESGIDTCCSSEYLIIAEEKNARSSHPLDGTERILPCWQRLMRDGGGRLLLSTQRLYVNVNSCENGLEGKTYAVRQKLYHQLNGQMTILDKQRKRLASLDEELSRLNQQRPTVEENLVAQKYNQLLEKLRQRTWQMWACELELNRHSHQNQSPERLLTERSLIADELRKAEAAGNKLTAQLNSLQEAEQELDRLLNLKRKHCYEVERLIKQPVAPESPTLAIQGYYTEPAGRQVCVQSGASACKSARIDRTDPVGINVDDDSDTGVSSMNSDELALCRSANRPGSPLETLV